MSALSAVALSDWLWVQLFCPFFPIQKHSFWHCKVLSQDWLLIQPFQLKTLQYIKFKRVVGCFILRSENWPCLLLYQYCSGFRRILESFIPVWEKCFLLPDRLCFRKRWTQVQGSDYSFTQKLFCTEINSISMLTAAIWFGFTGSAVTRVPVYPWVAENRSDTFPPLVYRDGRYFSLCWNRSSSRDSSHDYFFSQFNSTPCMLKDLTLCRRWFGDGRYFWLSWRKISGETLMPAF